MTGKFHLRNERRISNIEQGMLNDEVRVTSIFMNSLFLVQYLMKTEDSMSIEYRIANKK